LTEHSKKEGSAVIAKRVVQTVRQVSLLALLAVAIAGSGGASLAASPSCTELGAVADLRAVSGDFRKSTATLKIDRAIQGLSLEDDVLHVTGACRHDVVGFELSLVYLRNGRMVEIGQDRSVSPVREARSAGRFQAIAAGDDHPAWDKGEFVMATRVDIRRTSDGAVTESFIGVWKGRKASTVGVFRKAPNGSFSSPSALLVSSLPIRSVSYFPSPDAPSGRIGITQEAPESVRLVNASWFHPDLMK
jgi:hypothetical protein